MQIMLLQPVHPVASILVKDWRTHKYAFFTTLLLLLTTLVVVAYYLNHSGPEPLADSWSYLYVVDRIQTHGQLVNFWRLPGYPLLIVLAYTLSGQGNLAAVSAVQAALFVLATLELYVLAALVLQRAWAAFLISLFVGTNLTLLAYVKPIMSEAMALWLLVSLALAVALFLSAPRVHTLWLITATTLLLLLTRPEWIYLPIFLFAYLLLVAAWRGALRRLLPHALISLVLLYAVLGGYIYINATQNHFPGVTWIQNINALGKVLQYHMQDEAPPQYAGIQRTLDSYVAKGISDPYPILAHQPSLSADYAALAGAYSDSIIKHHLGEFLLKSVPVFFSSLTVFHDGSRVVPAGPFGPPLDWLQSESRALYQLNIGFPACALIWFLLLCWRRTRYLRLVQEMGAIVLISLYGLTSTTLGAYRAYDYMRIHTTFDPLLILVIGGTLLAGTVLIYRQILKSSRRPPPAGPLIPGSREGMTIGVGLAPPVSQGGLHRHLSVEGWRLGCKFVLLVALLATAILSSCSWQTPRSLADVIPILCDKQISTGMLKGTGVNILFITIENRGNDAGPSTMTVTFATNSPQVPRVQFEVKTPAIPAGAERWLSVDLPLAPGTTSVLEPVGKIMITVDSGKALPKTMHTLLTSCNDPT